MHVRQRLLWAAVMTCALICALPAHALANSTEDTILIDDQQLLYSSPDHVQQVLTQLAELGVDRIRVPLSWKIVAPSPNSRKAPKFDATNPHAYPAGHWANYDLLDRLCHQLGIGLYFQIAPPSPTWAIAKDPGIQGPVLGRYPNIKEFRQFMEAVGRRYDGTFVTKTPGTASDRVSSPITGGAPVTGLLTQQPPSSSPSNPPLPRVSYWGIWNEPNERSWLNPWHTYNNAKHLLQPSYYRNIVNAAWSGLHASGHGGDTILIGETANVGIMTPLAFIRGVYCVNSSDRPLTGGAAANVNCPTSGNRSKFVAANPGLFGATGYAHHPYAFDTPPNKRYPDPTWITLENIGTLERNLNRIFSTYHKGRHGGVPLYLTEFGYKTKPPNPYVTTTLADQAAWINEGEYMTWKLPYVRAFSQFELVDSGPKASAPRGSRAYWSTFQTGLEFQNGSPKPSYAAFRIPIWVPSPKHGSSVTIWGQLRPAKHSGAQIGFIQYRPRHGQWKLVRDVQTTNPRGFLLVHVPIPGAGAVRLAWAAGPNTDYYSRTVNIR